MPISISMKFPKKVKTLKSMIFIDFPGHMVHKCNNFGVWINDSLFKQYFQTLIF